MRNNENGSLEHCCYRADMAVAAMKQSRAHSGGAFVRDANRLTIPTTIIDLQSIWRWASGNELLENAAKQFPFDMTVT